MKIRAFAPASVGNVTCGFDVLGMALHAPGDEVVATFNEQQVLRIVEITGDDGKLPTSIAENTASIAVQEMLKALNEQRGIDLSIHKKMPLGSGMGSSAASAVAAVVAVNELLGKPFAQKESLMPFVLTAESFASGSVHGDNVLPSLLGGFVLIQSYSPLRIIRLPVPENLFCTLVHPDLQILTKEARAIIPQEVSLKKVVTQTAYLGGFIAGLYRSDFKLLKESLHDLLAEPHRQSLIKGFDSAKQAAISSGALNFGISGSGPSVYSFSDNLETAQSIAKVVQQSFADLEIESQSYVGSVNKEGAKVIEA